MPFKAKPTIKPIFNSKKISINFIKALFKYLIIYLSLFSVFYPLRKRNTSFDRNRLDNQNNHLLTTTNLVPNTINNVSKTNINSYCSINHTLTNKAISEEQLIKKIIDSYQNHQYEKIIEYGQKLIKIPLTHSNSFFAIALYYLSQEINISQKNLQNAIYSLKMAINHAIKEAASSHILEIYQEHLSMIRHRKKILGVNQNKTLRLTKLSLINFNSEINLNLSQNDAIALLRAGYKLIIKSDWQVATRPIASQESFSITSRFSTGHRLLLLSDGYYVYLFEGVVNNDILTIQEAIFNRNNFQISLNKHSNAFPQEFYQSITGLIDREGNIRTTFPSLPSNNSLHQLNFLPLIPLLGLLLAKIYNNFKARNELITASQQFTLLKTHNLNKKVLNQISLISSFFTSSPWRIKDDTAILNITREKFNIEVSHLEKLNLSFVSPFSLTSDNYDFFIQYFMQNYQAAYTDNQIEINLCKSQCKSYKQLLEDIKKIISKIYLTSDCYKRFLHQERISYIVKESQNLKNSLSLLKKYNYLHIENSINQANAKLLILTDLDISTSLQKLTHLQIEQLATFRQVVINIDNALTSIPSPSAINNEEKVAKKCQEIEAIKINIQSDKILKEQLEDNYSKLISMLNKLIYKPKNNPEIRYRP